MSNHAEPGGPVRRDRFRFQLRDLFVFTFVAAILVAWQIDRYQLNRRIALLELRLARKQQGISESAAGFQTPDPAMTPAELVAFVANNDDWNALQDVLAAFRNSPGRSDAVDALLKLTQAQDEIVRTRALSALAQIKARGDVVVPAVTLLLDDPAANVQWHAANVLGEFGSASPAALAALKRNMLDDQCGVATFAAIVLKKLDPTADIGPRLIELAQSPIRDNRRRALLHLRHHVSAETAKPLLTVAFENEEDQEIRNVIADALNQLDS